MRYQPRKAKLINKLPLGFVHELTQHGRKLTVSFLFLPLSEVFFYQQRYHRSVVACWRRCRSLYDRSQLRWRPWTLSPRLNGAHGSNCCPVAASSSRWQTTATGKKLRSTSVAVQSPCASQQRLLRANAPSLSAASNSLVRSARSMCAARGSVLQLKEELPPRARPPGRGGARASPKTPKRWASQVSHPCILPLYLCANFLT